MINGLGLSSAKNYMEPLLQSYNTWDSAGSWVYGTGTPEQDYMNPLRQPYSQWDSLYDSLYGSGGRPADYMEPLRQPYSPWDSLYDSLYGTGGRPEDYMEPLRQPYSPWDSLYDSLYGTGGRPADYMDPLRQPFSTWDSMFNFGGGYAPGQPDPYTPWQPLGGSSNPFGGYYNPGSIGQPYETWNPLKPFGYGPDGAYNSPFNAWNPYAANNNIYGAFSPFGNPFGLFGRPMFDGLSMLISLAGILFGDITNESHPLSFLFNIFRPQQTVDAPAEAVAATPADVAAAPADTTASQAVLDDGTGNTVSLANDMIDSSNGTVSSEVVQDQTVNTSSEEAPVVKPEPPIDDAPQPPVVEPVI